MYTVYMKGNSEIYKAGFESWTAANKWGKAMFGPGGYEIEQEWQNTQNNNIKLVHLTLLTLGVKVI